MSLRQRLAAEIAAEGPITVARYMDLCLHDPEGGYYATRPALGVDGDFLTAPLVSQMFGELVGLWCAAVWTAMGRPERVRWVELGPGDGTMMADMRRACARAAPDFLRAADMVLVETSAPLRDVQRARLGEGAGRWADTFAEAVGDRPFVLVANELLDCLPARQFVRTADATWAERRVGLGEGDALVFGLSPAPAGFAPPPGLEGAPPGVVVEASPSQAALGAQIGAYAARAPGVALLVDYGPDAPEPGDTLQALRRHARVDPLASPGEADLTVHADFPAVASAARAAGAAAALTPQGAFLRSLGVEARAAALAQARPDRADVIARQLHRLVGDDQMGTLFKALAIHPPGMPPPGFPEPSA